MFCRTGNDLYLESAVTEFIELERVEEIFVVPRSPGFNQRFIFFCPVVLEAELDLGELIDGDGFIRHV